MARTLLTVFLVKQRTEPTTTTYAIPRAALMSFLLQALKFSKQLSTMLKIIIHITEKKGKASIFFFLIISTTMKIQQLKG